MNGSQMQARASASLKAARSGQGRSQMKPAFRVMETYLVDHRSDSAAQSTELAKGLLQDSRERQETERVSRRRSVEYDHGVLHRLDMPA